MQSAPASSTTAPNTVSAPLFNIAQYLPAMAASAPERAAVICTHTPDFRGRTKLTFAEMDRESNQLAKGLHAIGVKPGMRTLLMVRPGLEFVTLTFALFKTGAVPVLIDPGMGGKNLLNCIRRSKPEAFIAIPLAHAIRTFAGGDAFDSVRVSVTVGARWFWGGPTLQHVFNHGRDADPQIAPTTRESDAAILFTTGSTGIPKGVVYKHGMFDAQVQAIREEYKIEPGEIDLPAFPLFALFSTALGTTCVIPEMDPTRPAQCDPEKIVRAIQEHGVTYSFGSPAIWKRVGPYLKERNLTLPNLKRILMAGAPVKGDVLEPFITALPNGDTFIPYGATEALPVTNMRGSEVVRETWALTRQGKGHCVGRPLPGVRVKIIREPQPLVALCKGENDDAKYTIIWDESLVLPPDQIGEIVVTSPMVTQEYFEMREETRHAKISDLGRGPSPLPIGDSHESCIWHRMGDMGYLDEIGRLWFCGRKAHRVQLAGGKVLYSVCVEAVFEAFLEKHITDRTLFPNGVRVALAGVGNPGQQRAYIVVEVFGAKWWRAFKPDAALLGDLDEFRRTHELAQDISDVLWYQGRFPVDIRHNAKINREALSAWAAGKF